MTRSARPLALITTVLIAALAAPALAGDLDPPSGAIEPTMRTQDEVEPRTIINLENTPGDADALFVIDTPGSYYLTGNVKGVTGKHGIKVTASHVTVDLMGFRLSGVTGSLDGLNVPDNAADNIEVRNGTSEGWDNDGIDLRYTTDSGVVRDVRVIGCAGTGIRVGDNCLVKNCVVRGSVFGIQTNQSCRVVECDVAECALAINVNAFSIVDRCVSHDNTSLGINLGSSCTVTGCSFVRNDSHGIQAFAGALIVGNTIRENAGDGINVNNGALIKDNVIRDNATGVHVEPGGQYCRVESNHCVANGVGILVDGDLNYIIRNTCADSTTNNYQIGINNRYGKIVDHTITGTPPVTGNSSSSFIGTEDPWANFAQ